MEGRRLSEAKEQETCECEEEPEDYRDEPRVAEIFKEELAKARARDMKKHIAQGKFLMESDQICKNCNKTFVKASNFSWSCSYHPDKWNGFIYTCCGKMKKFSPGCITSKHYWVNNKTERTQVCISCKETGHLTKDCPWDPNMRTGADPNEELKRIKKLRSSKFSQKIKTFKNYEAEDDGFGDINKLKCVVKEKNGSQEDNKLARKMLRNDTAPERLFIKTFLDP